MSKPTDIPQENTHLEDTSPENKNETLIEKRGIRVWDIIFSLVIIALIVVLVVAVKNKPTEGFTELYFEDHTNLPKFSDGNIEFTYSIHNLENKDYTYYVEIAVERDGKEKEVLDNQKYTLSNNETKTVNAKINVADFKKAKVIVTLKEKDQEIHFWTAYAKETLEYEGLGTGILDCLNTVKIGPGNKLVINAKGDYATGWPDMTVYIDGKKITTITVGNNQYYGIPIDYEFNKGVHVIDLVFINDYYDKTTNADRNLYVDKIWVGNTYISAKDGVYGKGLDNRMLDCEETEHTNFIYTNGALRFRVEVV